MLDLNLTEQEMKTLPESILTYRSVYQKIFDCLEIEENIIKNMDLKELQTISMQKQSCFDLFKTTLSQVLEQISIMKLSDSVKAFIKDSQKVIQQKMETNMNLLRIEASLLKSFFSDVSKHYEKPIATYGNVKKRYKPTMYATLPVKDL